MTSPKQAASGYLNRPLRELADVLAELCPKCKGDRCIIGPLGTLVPCPACRNDGTGKRPAPKREDVG